MTIFLITIIINKAILNNTHSIKNYSYEDNLYLIFCSLIYNYNLNLYNYLSQL